MSFGKRLRAARERRDFTAAALARDCGIDALQISHYECDRREPSAENIRKLCRSLDVTADYLLELGSETRRLTA